MEGGKLTISGLQLHFPYETPYKAQKNLMFRMIRCLNKEQNGLLESPTGTGKTLAILCAVLG